MKCTDDLRSHWWTSHQWHTPNEQPSRMQCSQQGRKMFGLRRFFHYDSSMFCDRIFRLPLPMIAWAALLPLAPALAPLYAARAADQEIEVPLVNALKSNSHLLVSVRLPFGQRYRAGCAFPIKALLSSSGPIHNVNVKITEGDGDYGVDATVMNDQPLTPAKSQSRPVCVRATDIRADLNVLVSDPGSANTVLFKGSLKPVLQPLPDETRVVLCCGDHSSEGLPKELNHVIPVTAKSFPDHDWMYESIDLVILSDGSFKDASPAARDALRAWLLGGGRLLVTSASAGALQAAIAAKLLPIKAGANVNPVPTDFKWWEANAGLTAADIMLRKNTLTPVYVQAQMGFGRVVFLYPGNDEADAHRYGLDLFKNPVLDRIRDRLPDQRVQPKACDTIVRRIMAPGRMSRSGIFFGVGALIFCGVLAGCYRVRSRLEAIGWVVCMPAILAVLLNSCFPEPRCVVSRVAWNSISRDGAASVRKEWALIEAFRHPEIVTVTGPANGTLMPVYPDKDHLFDAQFSMPVPGDRLQLENLYITEDAPALFEGVRVDAHDRGAAPPETVSLRSRKDGVTLLCHPPRDWRSARLAIWIDAQGSRKFIEQVDSREGFEVSKCADDRAAIRASIGSSGGQDVVNARAALLTQAARAAQENGSGRDTLIFWSGETESIESPLVEFPAESGQPPPEEGARFAVWCVEAARAADQ